MFDNIGKKLRFAVSLCGSRCYFMFDNIGKKLQMLAVIEFILGVIFSEIVGIVYICVNIEEDIFAGILTMILGPLSSWVGSWVTYALGLITENSERQTEYLKNISNKMDATADIRTTPPTPVAKPEPKTVAPVTPKVVVSPTQSAKTLPPLSKQDKEATYFYAIQMYKQGKYNTAYINFLKIPGYKDADEYIAKLQK